MDELSAAREHIQAGRLVEAVAVLKELSAARPCDSPALVLLGQSLLGLGRIDEALTTFENAAEIDPNSADSRLGLGIALSAKARTTEALYSVKEAARLQPENALTHLILGGLLRDLGRPEEALAACDIAVRLNSDIPEAHHRRGNALDDLCRFPEAIAAYQETLIRNSKHFDAINNLGASLGKLGQVEDALACFDHLLKSHSDHYSPHMNRALVWLSQGDYPRGFNEFEWRWKIPGNSPRARRKPSWKGERLEGRTILLHAEQGLGDTMQFIRYVPLLKVWGARVLVECPEPLHRLFQPCLGIDALSVRGEAPQEHDFHAPILSLPRLFKTTLETVPASVPYLAPEPASVERWRQRLSKRPGFRIGIVWQGDPTHHRDRVRSFRLSHFETLASLDEIRLIRLQKGFGSEQIATWRGEVPIEDPEAIAAGDWVDFQDTAGIMANLDLVITPDTSPAHLAGALGIPVWVVLPYSAEWRWLVGREDSPWYPSARLFRQREPGNWTELFGRVVTELKSRVGVVS